MPDETTTRPALSAEEWKAGWARIDHGGSLRVSTRRGRVEVDREADYDGCSGHIDPIARPDALAALALYGQPFGFSREDVELLRSLSFSARRHEGNPFDARVHSLADRIVALLPPP